MGTVAWPGGQRAEVVWARRRRVRLLLGGGVHDLGPARSAREALEVAERATQLGDSLFAVASVLAFSGATPRSPPSRADGGGR